MAAEPIDALAAALRHDIATPLLHDPATSEVTTCAGCGAPYRHDDVHGHCPLCATASDRWSDTRWGDSDARTVAMLVLASLANLLVLAAVFATAN